MSANASLMSRAEGVLVGGVNSPVRAFNSVGGTPPFIARAEGATLTDVAGKVYIDLIGSWGPMILGHAHPDVLAAVHEAADRGTSYGAPTEGEVRYAEEVCDAVDSIEMLRMTSSGTEAVMGALRLARGFTKRDIVVKFEGCYHGGADYLLVAAGSGAATLGTPNSAGIPASIAKTTHVLPFNDLEEAERCFAQIGDSIAAVIVEPVAGNMGCVPPSPGFLEGLRRLTSDAGALLVFDEVMTGFRLGRGGAQQRYGIAPDLTCLGKIIGGGLPVGAFGGSRKIMSQLAPSGPVYQGGTLSGNPLSVAAGMTTLRKLTPSVYEQLESKGAYLEAGLQKAISDHAARARVQRVGSMLTVFFSDQEVRNWKDADACDRKKFATWHQSLLEQGIYWPPSQFEAAFLSLAHTSAQLDHITQAASHSFRATRS